MNPPDPVSGAKVDSGEGSNIETIARVLHDRKWGVPAEVRKLALAREIAEALSASRTDETPCATCGHGRRFHADDPARCRLAPCPCEGFNVA